MKKMAHAPAGLRTIERGGVAARATRCALALRQARSGFPAARRSCRGILGTAALACATATVAIGPQVARGALAEAPPVAWGNAIYADLAVGESCTFLGRSVRLLSVKNDHCVIAVDETTTTVRVARRDRPTVINGIRLFVADTRPVAALTTDKAFPLVHGALTRDALLCLSAADQPLLDPARFTFPVSRDDGYRWTMDEHSGMFAYLSPARSHEGIDLNLHEARGRERHALVAVEDAIVRWAAPTGQPQEACVLLESAAQPGVFYVYQHLNLERLSVRAGDHVSRGQRLGYIWGDWRWGHLHFAVVARGPAPDYPDRYRYILNCFPQLCELWHGSLEAVAPPVTSGRFRFAAPYYFAEGRLRLHAFSETVGYGWLLGDWCAAGRVEYQGDHRPGQSARLSKTLHAESGFPAVNPDDWFAFETVVENGSYRVTAEIGDAFRSTWQRVEFEGVDAGSFALGAGQLAWTPETEVPVRDGRLTVRLHLRDDATPAGIRNLNFVITRPAGLAGSTGKLSRETRVLSPAASRSRKSGAAPPSP